MRPILETVHRPQLCAQKLGVSESALLTPELAAQLLRLEGGFTRVLLNQADTPERAQLGEKHGSDAGLPGLHRLAAKGDSQMLVLIRGAGDLASGVALRLWRAGLAVVMTDLPQPTAIRRTVCFSQAIRFGETTVEDVTAVLAKTPEDVKKGAAGRKNSRAGRPGGALPRVAAAGRAG